MTRRTIHARPLDAAGEHRASAFCPCRPVLAADILEPSTTVYVHRHSPDVRAHDGTGRRTGYDSREAPFDWLDHEPRDNPPASESGQSVNADARIVQALQSIGRDDVDAAVCQCAACRRLAAAIDADLAARKRVWDAGRAVDLAHQLPRVVRNYADAD